MGFIFVNLFNVESDTCNLATIQLNKMTMFLASNKKYTILKSIAIYKSY